MTFVVICPSSGLRCRYQYGWRAYTDISTRNNPIRFGCLLIALVLFAMGLSRPLHADTITNGQTSETSVGQANETRNDLIKKFEFGTERTLFCIPADYVAGVSHYNDGTPIVNLIMFLPDLSPSEVYEKLHPIPRSPIFQSPERVEYEHSILQIEVSSSYSGIDDPTGKIALRQTLDNPKPFDHPATTFPVEGFSEFDDRWGQPSIYFYNGKEPYGILCFRDSCYIDSVIHDSISVSMAIDKESIPGALDIIERFESLIGSIDCHI